MRRHLISPAVSSLVIGAALAGACGGGGGTQSTNGGETGAGAGASTTSGGTGAGGDDILFDGGMPCTGLQCQQASCSGGAKTTVSGTVYTPKGDLPLYNVVVYVPNTPLDTIPTGSSCDMCGAMLSGSPITSTITDTHGHFVLENVPAGADIPLVLQVGKWRRQITLPSVEKCADNPYDDPSLLRLPRNQAEGDLPRIALSTGGADPLECLLRKIGIDDAEFTPEAQSGKVNLFHGPGGSSKYASGLNGGASFTDAEDFWATTAGLSPYDIVLLACEGGQNTSQKPASSRQAMFDYTAAGGRVFASHWHNYWLEKGPDPFPQTATWNHDDDLADPFTALVDTSFPKGQALAEWLVNVGGATTLGEIVIHAGQHTVDAVNPTYSRQWIYSKNPQSVQYFTFNTPATAPPDMQCGRVVFSDIHVSSGDSVGSNFPSGCTTTDLTPQEKALIFMLFDLSACVMDDDDPPTPPPT